MASNYELIRKENIRKYGEATHHLAFLGRLYSDRTHFVYELLQNAEDAGAKKVALTLYSDRLEVLHDGEKLFDEDDVRGICGVGEGTKPEDLTKIGKFGIGFKSVYAYTDAPEIHCGQEHFGIKHYVRPYAIKPAEIPEPWTTRFVFPFKSSFESDISPCKEISARLKSLNVRTLLFLRNIDEIVWHVDGGESGLYLRQTENENGGSFRKVSVIGETRSESWLAGKLVDNVESESWLVFERAIVDPDGIAVKPVEIAFLIDPESAEGNAVEIMMTPDSPLFVFFATEKDTNLGFLVQGPYKTTPARDNIPRDDPWNAYLLGETAQFIVDVLQNLKDMGLLTVSVLETLPIRERYFPPESMFRPLYDRVLRALKDESLLPALGGGFIRGRDAILGRGDDVRTLLDSEQLLALFGDDIDEYGGERNKSLKWLSEKITQERTSDLRRYLISWLDIEEVTPESFARRVGSRFLSEQSDSWLIKLYKFMGRQPALWKRAAYKSSRFRFNREDGPIRHKEFVRLEDGRQVKAFSEDETVAVYLPHAHGEAQQLPLPTIKSELVRDSEAQKFFRTLGVQEPDITAVVLELVLPRYDSDKVEVSEQNHRGYIDLIVMALQDVSSKRRQELISRLKQCKFLVGSNAATNEAAYRLPQELYVRSEELSLFLEGNPDAWFLDRRYSDEQIEAFLDSELGLSNDWRVEQRLADQKGHVTLHRYRGRHERGLDGFDPECNVDHLEFALHSPTVERSLFVWKKVAEQLRLQIRGRVEKATRQTYENSQTKATFSTLGKLLRSNPWLPDVTGKFHKPSELSLADLPETFDRDEGLASQLGMRGSKQVVLAGLEVLAERSGFEVADLDLLRELKEMPGQLEKLKEMVELNRMKPSFPERPSANPKRRTERAKRDASEAPRKQYEERSRSVRTSTTAGDKDTYLRENYTNDNGQLVCQICKEEMPFRRRDGEYYFESVQLFDDLSGEHVAAHLALCPLCAAKYKEFVKRNPKYASTVRNSISSSEHLIVDIDLGRETGSIRFVEKHLLDVRGVLEEETSLRSV